VDEWQRMREGYRPPSAPSAPDWGPPTLPAPEFRPEPDDRGSERAARLTLTCLAASVTVLAIGLVVFFTVRTLRQNEQSLSPTIGSSPVTTPEDAARLVGGLGPPPGTDVPTYINNRKQALATATGDRVAVVSLTEYMTESDARDLVGSAEVLALLASPPGGQPAVVTGDLAGWVNSQTSEARAERAEIEKLLPTVEDASFRTFYRGELDRLNNVINATRASGDLVFGVVIRAPTPALQALGAEEAVRLVDVAPGPDPDPRANYRGLRPEETGKANDPNTRPT
jgi:hypothetical protein